MSGRHRLRAVVLAGLGALGVGSPVLADIAPQGWTGVPAQIVPQALETGAPTFTTPSESGMFMGNTGAGSTGSGGTSTDPASTTTGSGSAYDAMMATSYGSTALSTAQQLGINPNATAGFGVLESGFQNVGTANGSSSATGPWQITSSTWSGYVAKYNLPYTSADITNPDAQAVVANYILKDYSSQVSTSIGTPATVEQTYGAWVFGPSGGSKIAAATSPDAPLSNYVSAQALSNNNMTGWTVGQFYNRVSSKIGSVATQTVTS